MAECTFRFNLTLSGEAQSSFDHHVIIITWCIVYKPTFFWRTSQTTCSWRYRDVAFGELVQLFDWVIGNSSLSIFTKEREGVRFTCGYGGATDDLW